MAKSYEQFGKYLLLEKIAVGGMAEIYLARSKAANGLNKFFAIKRILPQFSKNEEFISMFKEEAKVAINLNHSNVVSIFDFGVEDGQFYLVMEYCEGRNLRQIINELKKVNKSFTIDQALFLIKEAAAGLDHAHRCTDSTSGRPLNITHRDMSPQNIMLSFEGEVKVIDFGIAKAERETEDTKDGTLKGKFSYMSPEQAEGQPIDPRTDIFALGIVLWELLANDRLFTGSNETAILRKVRDCQVPLIRKINPTVPQELERIVMKSLAKDRNVRYQTAANFHRDLNRFLNTQYPEFSPQDFSQFIKESFKSAYQEGRNNLMAYSKVSFEEFVTPATAPTVASAAIPAVPPLAEGANHHAPVAPIPAAQIPPLPVETREPPRVPVGLNSEKNVKIVLDDLLQTPPKKSKYPSPPTANINVHQTRSTQTSYSKKSNSADTGSDIFFKILLILALSFGGWYGYIYYFAEPKIKISSQSKTNERAQSIGEITSASNASIKASVSSNPENAQIFVDGRDTGNKTPAVISLTANKEIEIILKKNGYLDYKINRTFTETSQVLATLQASLATAYLNIGITGGNSFTKISVNGTPLIEKPPITKFPVIADKEITITAYNPITKLTDEIIITAKPNETKDVQLILGRNQNIRKK